MTPVEGGWFTLEDLYDCGVDSSTLVTGSTQKITSMVNLALSPTEC